MKMNKPVKITVIVLSSLIVLALTVSIGINFLINKQLPKIITERNDTAYDLTYEDIHFSVLKNSLSINNDQKQKPQSFYHFSDSAGYYSVAISGKRHAFHHLKTDFCGGYRQNKHSKGTSENDEYNG